VEFRGPPVDRFFLDVRYIVGVRICGTTRSRR